jgi:hypothetical protein
MEIVKTDPTNYISSLDEPDRTVMLTVDRLIGDAMPNRRRALWQGVFWGGTEQAIIGYGDIRQPRPRGEDVEWFLVGLSASIGFRHLEAVDLDVLAELLTQADSITPPDPVD